jgi:hypothetical protein
MMLSEGLHAEISSVLGVLTAKPVENYQQLHTAQALWSFQGIPYAVALLDEVERLKALLATASRPGSLSPEEVGLILGGVDAEYWAAAADGERRRREAKDGD